MGLDRQLLSSVSIHLHISFILRFEMTGSERNSSFCPQKKKKINRPQLRSYRVY